MLCLRPFRENYTQSLITGRFSDLRLTAKILPVHFGQWNNFSQIWAVT